MQPLTPGSTRMSVVPDAEPFAVWSCVLPSNGHASVGRVSACASVVGALTASSSPPHAGSTSNATPTAMTSTARIGSSSTTAADAGSPLGGDRTSKARRALLLQRGDALGEVRLADHAVEQRVGVVDRRVDRPLVVVPQLALHGRHR